jgi:hypothetical protein
MAFDPLVIHICGVNEIATMAAIGIHHKVGFFFTRVSAEDIAAKAEFMNDKVGFWDSDHARRLRHNYAHGDYNGWIFK